MICVASVPHTGSWFTTNFLEKLVDCESKRMVDLTEEVPLAHYHLGATYDGDFGYEHLEEGKIRSEYKEYFKKFPNYTTVSYLLKECKFKTVIPVRDPILSLITRQNRNPLLSHMLVIRGLRRVVFLEKQENVFFFPVDLYETEEDRYNLLNDLTAFVGISNDGIVRETARTWSKRNVSEDTTGLKKEYLNGNLEEIERIIPESNIIFNNSIVKGFMRNLGYDKLIWC